MKILALEFSSKQRSVAVLDGKSVLATAMETGGRTVRAFELIERALKEAHWEREQIECIAVGLGPGSYTGIRAAIALAQGWQLARDVKLLGISSVEALALQAQQEGFFGTVNIAIDAQRNEFYLAQYRISGLERAEAIPLRLVSLEEMLSHQRNGERITGPDVDGLPGSSALFPTAGAISLLAAERRDFVYGEKLEPVYLRETSFLKAPPPRDFSK
jgi:tRNA threonylcarbamoyl adenosine modification protein YeaZ